METNELYITIPDGKIYVKKWTPATVTEETPIILLHDSLGSVELWRNFPKELSENLSQPVIAYDRLGFGKSDSREKLPSIEFIHEEASKYFPIIKEKLNIQEYILFGHSVGGAMSICIAALDRYCKGVITVAAQAFVEDKTIDGIKKAKEFFESSGQLQKLEKWHGEKALWVLRAWTDIWLSSKFSSWSLQNCIQHVKCPVLAIHGEDDEYGSIAFPEFIAKNTGGVGLLSIIKNCKHMPHKEQSEKVINLTKHFVQKHILSSK